jgi:hypothetical protein
MVYFVLRRGINLRYIEYLVESTFDIKRDVDMIYKKCFKQFVDIVIRDKNYNVAVVMANKIQFQIDSSQLKSPDAVKAHQIKGVTIYCGCSDILSQYIAKRGQIYITLPKNVVEFLTYQKGNTDFLVKGYHKLSVWNNLSEVSIKGTIAHELTHWIDDALHNSFLEKNITTERFSSTGEVAKYATKGKSTQIGATNFEINAQIAAFKEILSKYKQKKYDTFTLFDILVLKPQLGYQFELVKNKEEYMYYVKRIFTRLSREGLLGKSMRLPTYKEIKKLVGN